MATLLSAATGNFTSSGTWALCNSTAEVDSETNSTSSLTSYAPANGATGTQFAPGIITIDGIAIKIATNQATGTFTVDLYNNTISAQVSGSEVTVNVTDLPLVGWAFIKFASPITLLAANNYIVQIKSSSNNTVTLYRDATAANWSRQFRTTTAQAPAAGDKLIIAGELTGAGTGNSFTVTMDSTASTSYGSTAFPQSITVNKRGTFTFGTSASTNYKLQFKGIMQVNDAATLNTGTTGTPMPSTSTATIQFDVAANVDTGLIINSGGTWNGRGNALSFVKTLLAANASAAATSLTTSDSTGWKNGDTIAIASTTRTLADNESKALTADASGTSLTIAAITVAHSGTSPTQAELGNLTRNVKILGTSSSLQGYVLFQSGAIVDLQYLEFANLGSGTTNKRGIDVLQTTGTLNFQYNSLHDFSVANSNGLRVSGTTGNALVISNNVFYNFVSESIQALVTSGVNTYDNNLFINPNATTGMNILDAGSTYTNNTVSGSSPSFNISETNTMGTFSGNTSHGSGSAFSVSSVNGGALSNTTIWRTNSTSAFRITSNANNVFVDGLTMFGNAGGNLAIGSCGKCTFNNVTANGDTTFSTTSGILFPDQGSSADVLITNSDFGTVSGIKTAHTQDIACVSSAYVQVTLYNTKLASSTEVASQSLMPNYSYIRSQKHDQTAGNHKTFLKYGTLTIDTTIFDSSPSERLTPNTAGNKLQSSSFFAAVDSGGTATVSVKVRESVSGDGTAYNGNRIRLIVRQNVAAGISADTVLATATSASNGAFETISGTTASVTDDAVLEFFVDCDGTTGWTNVDTWSAPAAKSTLGEKYWKDGNFFAYGNNSTGSAVGYRTKLRTIGT